eukprot:s2381_g8.t2
MLLSQPLRLTRKVAADQPSLKPPAPEDGRPVVRLRLAEPQQNAGWCVDAQRSVKADQRDCTSTRVSAHRPGLAGGEWQLEPGSADFQFLIRFVSNHFSQTSGWLLDVAEDSQRCHSVIVRKDDDNVPAAEWMIEPQGGLDVSSGVSPTYRLRLAVGPSEAVGWFLNVDSKPCNRRTTDSVYLHVSPSNFAMWIFEVQKAKAPRSLVPSLRQERLYEVVVCNLSGRPLILQGCQDVATRTRKAIAGSFLQLVPVVSALEGTEDHGAALVERVLLQNPVSHPSPTVQAKFQHSGSCGDLLEFSVTYLTVEGQFPVIECFGQANATSKVVRSISLSYEPCILVIATGGTIDKAYPRVTGGWGFEIGDPAAGRILDRIFPAGRARASLGGLLVIGIMLKSGHQANLSDRRNASRKIRGHGCSLQHGCLLRRFGHGYAWYIRVHEWAGSAMDIRSGVTIRVNAHAASPMQSSIQVHAQDLEVTSVMQNVPRLRVRPPAGYEGTSLGVESGPGRADRSDAPIFMLRVHDEVMAGMGPRQGRWLKITHPVEGWVQAATRDGQDILKEVVGCRPNLRQVVTVRPASKRPEPSKPAGFREKARVGVDGQKAFLPLTSRVLRLRSQYIVNCRHGG